MTWYKTGTVSVTNGSPNVTLASGDAQLNIFADDGFVGPDGRTYAILQVNNATTFVLSENYRGPTIAGQNYVIIPTADHVQLRDMLIGVNTLITEYSELLGGAGAGRFESGDASQPGVRGEDHDGTGLVWNADGSLSIAVNGVAVATIGPDGLNDVGINGYTEGIQSGSGTSFSPDIASSTIFSYATTGNATITLPTAIAGKSFSIAVQYGGAHTLAWSGALRRWPNGVEPTATSASGKIDVFSFMCIANGTWLAFMSGENL